MPKNIPNVWKTGKEKSSTSPVMPVPFMVSSTLEVSEHAVPPINAATKTKISQKPHDLFLCGLMAYYFVLLYWNLSFSGRGESKRRRVCGPTCIA